MFGSHHFDRVRQLFADQFEPDGSNFIYRKSINGAPIRVSETERNTFLVTFGKRLRYIAWGIFPATLLLIGLLVVLGPDPESLSSDIFIYVGIGLIVAISMIAYYWAWNAPARELIRRPTLGEARSRAETRQVMLSRMIYGQLAIGMGAIAALLLKVSDDTDLLHGWGQLWLIFAGIIGAGILLQAYRKWRLDREFDV